MKDAPPGLQLRNGLWHIDKVISGVRICKSTKTRNLTRAKLILETIEEEHADFGFAPQEWKDEVRAALRDSRTWLRRAWASARRRGRETGKGCSLTLADVRWIAIRSHGRCQISGVAFDFSENARAFRPSLDRIECSDGYHAGNCRLVSLIVNVALSDWGADALQIVARALVAKELAEMPTRKVTSVNSEKTSK